MMNSLEKQHFTFVEELTREAVEVDAELPTRRKQYCLGGAIHQFDRVRPSARRRYYSIKTGETGHTVLLNEPYLIDKQLLVAPIQIFYHEPTESEDESSSEPTKKQRNGERTIRQVILSVKRWREYHRSRGNGVRMSLGDAAERLGMSKKSLDDYFCQLRLGEKHGFDFMGKLSSGIGELRSFVKSHRDKLPKGEKNQRHPRILHILELFEAEDLQEAECKGRRAPRAHEDPPSRTSAGSSSYQWKETAWNSQDPTDCLTLTQTPMDKLNEQQLQNQFYRNMQFVLDGHQNEFLPEASPTESKCPPEKPQEPMEFSSPSLLEIQ